MVMRQGEGDVPGSASATVEDGTSQGEGDVPSSASAMVEEDPVSKSEQPGKRVAGFVELAPQFQWTAQDLYAELQRVPGVLKVSWDTPCEANILVWSSLAGPEAANKPLEFLVKQYMSPGGAASAITVCFKEPPTGLFREARRGLSTVCAGKELFPKGQRPQ